MIQNGALFKKRKKNHLSSDTVSITFFGQASCKEDLHCKNEAECFPCHTEQMKMNRIFQQHSPKDGSVRSRDRDRTESEAAMEESGFLSADKDSCRH